MAASFWISPQPMKQTKNHERVPIQYGDVVCLLTGHDAEWSRRHAHGQHDGDASLQNAFRRVFDEVRRITHRYRSGLNENAKMAFSAEDLANMPEVPSHLFSPIEYLPIGHADALTVTLFDDLDPIHSLTAQCSTTIEEVAVGFSPLVDSIWKHHKHGKPAGVKVFL